MIGPEQIKQKAERHYSRAVCAWLANDPTYFPLRLKCDLSLPESQSELIQQVDTLRSESKVARGFGYSITWEEKAKRLYGRNHYPVAISIDSLDDLVKLLRKVTEFERVRKTTAQVLSEFPQLTAWVTKNWQRLLDVEPQLAELIAVTKYMIEHPRPNCFTRELPLSVSTKVIERNQWLLSAWFDALLPVGAIDYGVTQNFEQRYGFRYPQSQLLIRFLDPALALELNSPWLELSLPPDSIAALQIQNANVFIVENKVNLLTLPPVSRGIALGGLGRGITAVYNAQWLARQPIYYWGDMDLDGFAILSDIRHRFPQTLSLFMDAGTLIQFKSLATKTTERTIAEPTTLTASELAAYRTCKAEGLRLEQEHIPQSVVNQRIASIVAAC